MKEYGEFIEEIITVSGQKYYLLAKKLGYDVSYISKWIKGIKLPSKKNISIINKGIVEFITESINESQIDKIIDMYDIYNFTQGDKLYSVKSYIEKALFEYYNYTLDNKKNEKEKLQTNVELKETKKIIQNNSNITVGPSLKRKLIDSALREKIENEELTDIITMSNLFSINNGDKLYALKVSSNYKNIKTMKYILNLEKVEGYDPIYDPILLTIIATQNKNIETDLYEYDFPSYTCVTVVKDKIMHSAIYNKSRLGFLTSSSLEYEIVRETYDRLEDITINEASKIFTKYNAEDMIKNKIYNKYILSNNIRILMGNMDELFMPEKLFLEIGEQLFSHDNKIKNDLLEINNILKNSTYKRKIKILIYEKSIIDYILKGEMIFFNKKIKLSTNQMKEHFKYFEKVILDNDNIEIGLVKDDFIEEFKHFKKTSLYLSKMSNLLRCTNENQEEFLVNRSKNLTKLFDEFYDVIWASEKDKIIFDKKAIFENLNNDFEYII